MWATERDRSVLFLYSKLPTTIMNRLYNQNKISDIVVQIYVSFTSRLDV